MSDKVVMTFQVSKELRRQAKIAAAQRGDALSEILRTALEEYVEDTTASPDLIEAYEEWKRDSSTARPLEEFEAELRSDGLLDG